MAATRGAVLLAAAVAAAASAGGQPGPAAPKIGEVVVQTIPPRHYLATGFDTDFKGMVGPVRKALGGLWDAARDRKLLLPGPVVHRYPTAPHRQPDKGFRMETGYYIPGGAADVGDFRVRALPEFKCASLLYVGPAPRIGEAWQALYREARGRGLTPTDEERELYLYFEASDSPNNVVQVQVGVR